MSKTEIDNLIKLLTDMKKGKGFFRGFWSTFTESVNLMAEGEVVIESMWSPAQTVLLEQGKDVGFAAPKEGFRGWCGCTMVYKHVTGATLDAAYKYRNWWLSGFPGANMARQLLQPTSGHHQEVPFQGGMGLPGTAESPPRRTSWDLTASRPSRRDRSARAARSRNGSASILRGIRPNRRTPDSMGTQWNNFISA